MTNSENTDDTIRLEKLRKKLFLEDSSFKKIEEYIDDLVKFAKIDNIGNVYFNIEISSKDKVLVYSIARFLAHKFNEKITEIIDVENVSINCGIDKIQATARLFDLKKEKYIISAERGKYQFNRYKLENSLKYLKEKYGDVSE